MLWVDLAILSLAGIYTVYGFFRGLSQETYAFTIWIVGVIIAWFFSQNFSVLLLKYFPDTQARLVASFLGLLLLTLATGWLVRLILGEALKRSGLTIFERLSGTFIGFLHGLLVITVLTLVSGLTALPEENWWFKSKYIPAFQAVTAFAISHSRSRLAAVIKYPQPTQ
jgi:membrane protein required for colicin V production